LLITIIAAALLVVCFAAFPVIRYMLSFYTYEIKELITPSKSSKLKLVGMSIYRAAETGDTEAVKKHINAGIDLNMKRSGMTPLHYAALYRHKENMDLLVVNGANLNAKDKYGSTPLDRCKSKEDLSNILQKHGGKTSEELKSEVISK
jgi:hypothetical protein